jgi:hypothetical protein
MFCSRKAIASALFVVFLALLAPIASNAQQTTEQFLISSGFNPIAGAVAELVGIEVGVVSGVINLESSGVEAPDWRPRHDERYHEA